MNKQLTVCLIIASIFILALKDSASVIHTLLHYIPNNPWHQHTTSTHIHNVNAMEIHKHLQHKHSHEHAHVHTHDIMDHLHAAENGSHDSSLPHITYSIKIDLFIQSYPDLSIQKNKRYVSVKHHSFYSVTQITHFIPSLFQPPKQV